MTNTPLSRKELAMLCRYLRQQANSARRQAKTARYESFRWKAEGRADAYAIAAKHLRRILRITQQTRKNGQEATAQ